MRECLLLAAAALVVAAGACGARTPLYGGGSGSGSSGGTISSGSSSGVTGSSGSSSGTPDATAPGCPGIPPAASGSAGGSDGGTAVVFASVPQAYGLAVDSTNLYVASSQEGPVSVVPLDGGPVAALDAIGQYAVALNAAGVFTIASGKGIVASCPKTGCGGAYTTLATGQFDVGDVAADDRYVYWTSQGIVDGQFPGVMRVPVNGGALVALLPGGDTEQIVAVGGRVFFISNFGHELCAVSPDGGLSQSQPPPLGASGASALTADCTNVYFATGDGRVGLVPVDGGPQTILATSAANPPEPATQIAVDAASVYFIRSETYAGPNAGPAAAGSGVLQSVPIAGGPVTTLATMSYAPNGIAVDADYVYWTDTSGGKVLRIAK